MKRMIMSEKYGVSDTAVKEWGDDSDIWHWNNSVILISF